MVGVNDLSIDSNETWTERRVEKMYQHPKFEEMKGSSYYDVAIIGESNLIVHWGIFINSWLLRCCTAREGGSRY